MTTNERVKGQNETTGTVHYAQNRKDRGTVFLLQTCGFNETQLFGLTATDAEVTCKRCLRAAAPKAAKIAKTAPVRTAAPRGPVLWGVYTTSGDLRCWRQTRREALAVAEQGETVGKLA